MKIDKDILYVGTAITAAFSIVLALTFVSVIQDKKKWQEFSSSHSCKAVSSHPPEMYSTLGVSSIGQVVLATGSTPPRTGWLCSDGVTYYRTTEVAK